MSYYNDGGEHEYGQEDEDHVCGRCSCALSDLEMAESIIDDDGELLCAECWKEAAQERSCADIGEPLTPAPELEIGMTVTLSPGLQEYLGTPGPLVITKLLTGR